MGEMTNENAIRWLKDLLKSDLPMEQYQTAIEKGIEALEQEPCEDAISRQAVLNLVVANHTELNGVNVVMYSPLCKDIKQLPPVNPQPKTGHWILTDDDFVYCSECEDSYYPRPIDASWYYCPHCGAKMESEV